MRLRQWFIPYVGLTLVSLPSVFFTIVLLTSFTESVPVRIAFGMLGFGLEVVKILLIHDRAERGWQARLVLSIMVLLLLLSSTFATTVSVFSSMDTAAQTIQSDDRSVELVDDQIQQVEADIRYLSEIREGFGADWTTNRAQNLEQIADLRSELSTLNERRVEIIAGAGEAPEVTHYVPSFIVGLSEVLDVNDRLISQLIALIIGIITDGAIITMAIMVRSKDAGGTEAGTSRSDSEQNNHRRIRNYIEATFPNQPHGQLKGFKAIRELFDGNEYDFKTARAALKREKLIYVIGKSTYSAVSKDQALSRIASQAA